jgi:hypothetical protein
MMQPDFIDAQYMGHAWALIGAAFAIYVLLEYRKFRNAAKSHAASTLGWNDWPRDLLFTDEQHKFDTVARRLMAEADMLDFTHCCKHCRNIIAGRGMTEAWANYAAHVKDNHQ